jgi:site-specific DNA recombinase
MSTPNGNTPTRPRAIIHTRVSTSDQAENTSHNSQLAAAMKKADELGADVIATFKEEISGALYEARPDIQTSLSMIEDGRAEMIIFARLDRAGRDVGNLRDVKKRVEAAGGQLIFADGLQFQTGAVGNLLYTQLAGFAEFEREIIRERMVAGLVATAKNGQQPARSVSPYGYYIPTHADAIRGTYKAEDVGKYFLVEDEARHVRTMFEMYVAGASLRDIARHLNAQNIPTPRGGSQWRAETISSFLKNETYKGTPAYRKTKRIVDEKRILRGFSKIDIEQKRPEDERIYLTAPRVVSDELWRTANERLERARAERSGRTDRKYMLSGLMWCSKCGARMYARSDRQKAKRGNHAPNYICRDALPSDSDAHKKCKSKSFFAPLLERLVIDAVTHLLEHPALIVDAARIYDARRKAQNPRGAVKTEIKALEREYSQIEKRERATVELKIEARVAGALTGIYDKVLSECAARKAEIETELATRREILTSSPQPQLAIPTMPAAQLRRALESPDVSGAEKHALLWPMIDRIYATGTRERVKIEIVLFTASKAPVYILSNRAGNIELRVEDPSPFPAPPARRESYSLGRNVP